MKLTKQDKETLSHSGFPKEDFEQIEEAMKIRNTKYEMIKDGKSERISRKRAVEILGRKEYLSGIARSAFHWSSRRDSKNGEQVYFDSSSLFA